MKRNYEKEIKIFKEMLIKGVSNDIILQTLTLFENYNTEEVEEKEDAVETKEEEDNIESKIETLKEEIKIENVLKKPVKDKIKSIVKSKIKIDINDISEHFNLIESIAKSYKSFIGSNKSKNKVFFIYNEETDKYKVLFPFLDKELLLNLNTLIKNGLEKNMNLKSIVNKKVFKCNIKETKNGFKIILNPIGDKEISFYIHSTMYKNYSKMVYYTFNISGICDTIKDMINKSFSICNNVKFNLDEYTIDFNFNSKVNEITYPSTMTVLYVKKGMLYTPQRLIINNSGIANKLKLINLGEESGIFNDFNSKFNNEMYNVYANNNILVVVPKNKNIKNEFIKNFMLNDNIYKIDIDFRLVGRYVEKFINIKNNMSNNFYSKFEQFSSLLDNINGRDKQYLSFEVKTTHILEEDSWIFDFNNLNVDNLIL